jgi:hypothetical protein
VTPLAWAALAAWAGVTAGTAIWYARAFRRTECGPRGRDDRRLCQ